MKTTRFECWTCGTLYESRPDGEGWTVHLVRGAGCEGCADSMAASGVEKTLAEAKALGFPREILDVPGVRFVHLPRLIIGSRS